jgi:sugar phosphate isomerase/epimerase
MAIGLSTYSFFWRASERVPHPLDLPQMLQQTAELGTDVFQICDFKAIEAFGVSELLDLKRQADDLGLELELGTRGLDTEHLRKYLGFAEILGVRLIRSMFNSNSLKPTSDQALALLQTVIPQFVEQDVKLALETYEQVPTRRVLQVIERIDSPWLGICLDPGNCVAALENPTDVIDMTAERVLNLHVKDFAFSRRDGWVGFTFAGCPMGEGLLDYAYMRSKVRPDTRHINQIIEHWLPWQLDAASTCALEDQWTRHNLNYLTTRQTEE